MSALSRFGPLAARSLFIRSHRHMASAATVSDPIQRLFLEKIREMKTSDKGLDEVHQKRLKEEMSRLQRVFQIDDEKKLAHLEHKFSNEVDVSLHDLESSKELRATISSGSQQKQLAAESSEESALLASIPDQTRHDMHLPPLNKPDPDIILDNIGVPRPLAVDKDLPDYMRPAAKMTAEQLERDMNIKFGDNMPTIHDDDSPQRDKVNFPREKPPLDCPPTRYHILPESWFQFFYPKTGVTGPYAFAGAFGTFLLSKEWLVMEHELLTGLSSIVIFAYAIPKYGPQVREWLVGMTKREVEDWDTWQKGNIAFLNKMIDHYKGQLQTGGDVIEEIYNARKQDIDLQLECEYRRRLKNVYDDTKRRLNYLVAVADSQRQIHHSNLVLNVISNVLKSFGPKQENEVLDDCIKNLKQLASRNVNAI